MTELVKAHLCDYNLVRHINEDLIRQHNEYHPGLFSTQQLSYLEFIDCLINGRYYFLTVNGYKVAFAKVALHQTSGSYTPKRYLMVLQWYVFPKDRRNHYATQLFKECCNLAKNLGASSIRYNVYEQNDTMKKFCESVGLEPQNTTYITTL